MVLLKDFSNMIFLVAGITLTLAISNLPEWYYDVLRYFICAVCFYGAYLKNKEKNIKWICIFLVIAVVFNPFLRISLTKGNWELMDFVAASCCFIAFYIGNMSRKFWNISFLGVWFLCALLFVSAFYVNHFLPHGESYETGFDVCDNDERGPCGPEVKEDLRSLNIPRWAKVLRKDGTTFFIVLLILGGLVTVRKFENDKNI